MELKKENSFPWLWITLIVVVLAAIGYFGWYFYVKSRVIIPVVPMPISTADWKTYENKDLGFNIKYPSSWFVREDSSNSDSGVYIQNKQEMGEYNPDDQAAVSFSKYSGDKSAMDARNEKCSELNTADFVSKRSEIKLDNVNVYSCQKIYRKPTEGGPVQFVTYYVEKPELLTITISSSLVETSNSFGSAEQIVKSIKFNQDSQTADWKTYENKDLGFSFKYPADWQNFNFEQNCYKDENGKDNCETYRGETKDYSFYVLAYPKNYTSYLTGTINTQKVNLNWSNEEFIKSNISDKTVHFVPEVKKLGNNALLTIQYMFYECSPSIDAFIYIPTNNPNYPNLTIMIPLDSKKGNEISQDPIMTNYNKKILLYVIRPMIKSYQRLSTEIIL